MFPYNYFYFCKISSNGFTFILNFSYLSLCFFFFFFYNSALALISCFHRASRSASSESLRAFSVLFWAYAYNQGMHTVLHMCVALDSQEQGRDFQNPPWTSHCSPFPFKYFGQSFVCSHFYHCLRQLLCSTIATYCFGQMPSGKRLSTWRKLWVRSNKYKPFECMFPGNCQTEE